MTRKGFTLIELLAVIVILTIILAIAVPGISSVIDSTRLAAYKSNERLLLKAAKNYLLTNESSFPAEIGDTNRINLSELQSNRAIGTIQDVTDKTKTCSGYVLIRKSSSTEYIYTPFLWCNGNYVSSTRIEYGLLAWYKFDGNANDSSGNERHGTEIGSLSITDGKIGESYVLNSNDDYISIPNDETISNEVFGISNVFSMSAWVYPTAWEDWASIVNKASNGSWSNSTAGIWASTNGFTAIMGANVDGNPSGSYVSLHYKPPLNNWYNVAAVADGVYLALYVDGRLISKTLISALTYPRSTNNQPITIGRRATSVTPSFKGMIDDVRIYNIALTDDEVMHNYEIDKER